MRAARHAPRLHGFTLIELMIVMAVLSIFLMMTAIVSRGALDMYSATKARIVAERNSAAFMRQFAADIAQRVARLEARTKVVKAVGNDELVLLTQRRGYALGEAAADRQVSLVSYRIKHNMLERAASGYGYGSPQQRPDEQAGTLALARVPVEGPLESADKAYQVIAPGIIRLEFSFLVREADHWVMRAEPPLDQQQIEAVIATVAVVDPDRSRLLDETRLALVGAEFPDASDNELPYAKWSAAAANLSRNLPQIPRPALQQVRVYQGIFTLSNAKLLP